MSNVFFIAPVGMLIGLSMTKKGFSRSSGPEE